MEQRELRIKETLPSILAAVICVAVGLAIGWSLPARTIIINLPPGWLAKDFTGHLSLDPPNYSAIFGTIPAILSAIVAMVAVGLTKRQLRFSHQERIAALRVALMAKKAEIYTGTLDVMMDVNVALGSMSMITTRGGKDDYLQITTSTSETMKGLPTVSHRMTLFASPECTKKFGMWMIFATMRHKEISETPLGSEPPHEAISGEKLSGLLRETAEAMRSDLAIDSLTENTKDVLTNGKSGG